MANKKAGPLAGALSVRARLFCHSPILFWNIWLPSYLRIQRVSIGYPQISSKVTVNDKYLKLVNLNFLATCLGQNRLPVFFSELSAGPLFRRFGKGRLKSRRVVHVFRDGIAQARSVRGFQAAHDRLARVCGNREHDFRVAHVQVIESRRRAVR